MKIPVYKCKLCPFITVDEEAAFAHLNIHCSINIGDNLKSIFSRHFKIISGGVNVKNIDGYSKVQEKLEIVIDTSESTGSNKIASIPFVDRTKKHHTQSVTNEITTSDITLTKDDKVIENDEETLSESELADKVLFELFGQRRAPKIVCKCKSCNYVAKDLNKLIVHIITTHHPDQSEDWVKINFSSLFTPAPVKKTKKKIAKATNCFSNNSKVLRPASKHSYHSFTTGESGLVSIYFPRGFDYDLDGRVK